MIPLPSGLWQSRGPHLRGPDKARTALARIGGHVAADRAVVMNALRVIEWRPGGAT